MMPLIIRCQAGSDWMVTSSIATLPAQEPSFEWELSGASYHMAWVHTVPQGDTTVMEVWVWVDPGKETQATYDVIYDHTTASGKKHGIANSAGARLPPPSCREKGVGNTDRQVT
jgi:hypothetical protein